MAELTPMLAQYLKVKEEYPQTLVFFRLGDFYELFNDDALIASRVLEIVLTGREAGKDLRMPMCGVPYHAANQYIAKLLARGYRVAICEQIEDPRTAKGLVARDVVRVYTPGTVVEDSLLPARAANYLAAIALANGRYGLGAIDLSTGEFLLTEVKEAKLIEDELARLAPAELLLPSDLPLAADPGGTKIVEAAHFADPAASQARLARHFEIASADSLGLGSRPAAACAASAILSYLDLTHRGQVPHLAWPRLYQIDEFMYLDANTRRNLELVKNLRDGKQEGTLLSVIDRTVSAMGARTLRSWLESPLSRVAVIEARLEAVAELTKNLQRREELRDLLAEAADLPRLTSRLNTAGGNGRDLLGLGRTLALLPCLRQAGEGLSAGILQELFAPLAPWPELAGDLTAAIATEAPLSVKEGGIFNPGYHHELDELREAAGQGRKYLAELEAGERERTGIRSLKIGYNQVFGYFLEVTKSNLSSVPADYIRRQTLANAERFVTERLKDYESKILGADERARLLEHQLFLELRERVVASTPRLQSIGNALGQLDALLSLAEVAVRHGYSRPEICEEGVLQLNSARHPVVEQYLSSGAFVPNDTDLSPAGVRVQIVTGPNMSGKSTYLRQVALVALLAHMGSFVPADSARIGLIDRIFTRIGAADDLAGGRSTFLVEMTETAEILRSATGASLMVLDEIGRGTGTIDGQAIARAVLEYIHDRIQARAIFATHYHDLTALAEGRPGMANFNVAVIREGDEIRFYHRLQAGAADRSYGIEVARLAGLPPAVLARAREVQLELEGARVSHLPRSLQAPTAQLALFAADQGEILESLRELDLSALTPLEAMNFLAELQEKIRGQRREKRHSKRSHGR